MRLLFWKPHPVAVLELHGTLSPRAGALNIAAVGPLIDRAMAAAGDGGTVVLDIDSPGGSPVQSDLIAARLRARAAEHKVRLVAVIGEVGASGGYWLACAGDEILANPMSVVGSIGVVGGGFGFQHALARVGVERRLYTAGANKARLDPFTRERPEDVDFVRDLMSRLHERFKAWVRERRGARLRGQEADVFDGGWMLGEQALALGLIDRLGDLDGVVRELGGKRARSQVIRPRRRAMLDRLPRLLADAVVDAARDAAAPRL
jgi:signal peptide peptidase SppA